MVIPGSKPSPIFEFYCYSIYKERNSEQPRLKTFRIYDCGHALAFRKMREMDEHAEIDEMINSNKLDYFFKCIKRKSATPAAESFKGFTEFVSDIPITKAQVEFFRTHRTMV